MQALAEIRSLIARHAGGRGTPPLGGIRLRTSTAPTEPLNTIYEPAFALVAQGGKRTVAGEHVYQYSAGQYLVVSIDLPVVGQVIRASKAEPYLAFAMILEPEKVAALLLESCFDSGNGGLYRGLGVSQAPANLLDPITRLLRLYDRPQDAAVLGPMLEREILWRLLSGEQGPLIRQIGAADSRLTQVGRAIQWIRAHYAETLRIERLAQLAGMSAASFHRHFRGITALSPLQYQKQVRLQQARAMLLASAQDVAAVGFEVGYDSPSQFSREYSRLFGAPPGKDMARLRTLPRIEDSLA